MKVLSTIGLLFSFIFASLRFGFVPTIVFDAAVEGPAVSSRASGFLYGLAEENVPDSLMAQSLDISSVSQKVIGGLQHPIGDVDHVADNLKTCDYIVVYLQDAYSTWYYDNDNIFDARKAGTYDWQTYIEEDYFPKVREKVTALMQKDYADRLVYCLYNECDNGVWFGTWQPDGEWAAFDDAGRANFFEAWKQTYALVRSIDPNAKIGGPGYCDYTPEKAAWFLNYCAENDCLPDVMIWHELGERSSEQMDLHVENYRNIEEISDVSPLPIIITEYGMMEECGNPARMFRYIRQIEETGVWGNIAYWRLADNLCDTCADGVSPNACWWLYRWYADMEGTRLEKEVADLFHADFKNALRDGRELRNKHYNGFGAITDEKDAVSILVGGADYTGQVKLRHLGETNLGRHVRVKVESVTFQGLGGKVFAPVTVKEYDASVFFGSLKIKLENMDPDTVYHISVVPSETKAYAYINENLPARWEFESGTLLGTAYTYDSAYATTGEIAGMVGGIEHEGDGVKLIFTVPETGTYDLDLIYGKANDGEKSSDRRSAEANLRLDGAQQTLTLPNTIRSEYTSKYTLKAKLEKGDHSIELTHGSGTFVLDSLLVSPAAPLADVTLLPEKEASNENTAGYLALAPENGWYRIGTVSEVAVNGSACAGEYLYLRQGLNLLQLTGGTGAFEIHTTTKDFTAVSLSAQDLTLAGGAKLENGAVTDITSEGGEAQATFSVPNAGEYRVTLTYSNNAEGGYHAYNVDLIEEYVTVTAGNAAQNVWCRNTYSSENRAAVTFTVRLAAGENTLVFSNDGAVAFDGRVNTAPDLYALTVCPVSADE